MPLPRYTESWLRQIIELLSKARSVDDPTQIAQRLIQLWRNLEPEDEFSMILSWLGKCSLAHKLSQEQLPLNSVKTYSVPDLLAVFEYRGESIPTLIEVTTTEDEVLKGLKPGYLRYADMLGLPMLIAWRRGTFWTLFDMRQAVLAKVNYKIDFSRAVEENLMSLIAGDFLYKIAPGTAISMRIDKLGKPKQDGSFEGVCTDFHFVSPEGERVPEIPYLHSLFLFLDNNVELIENDDTAVQRFVICDTGTSELASRTLPNIVNALAAMREREVDWRAIIHDLEHWAHSPGHFKSAISAAARHGIAAKVRRWQPKHRPTFL